MTGEEAWEAYRAAIPEWVCNVPAGPYAELSPALRQGFEAIASREQLAAGMLAEADLVRGILESLCRRDGLPLESAAIPGEPAANYELAVRLGIGHVFGLPAGQGLPAPGPAGDAPAFALDPAVKLGAMAGDRAQLLAALENLFGRTEGKGLLAGDEEAGYRRLIGAMKPGGAAP